jgi:hypothetical protein
MHRRQHAITALNSLLQSELSAVETYDQAVDLVDDDSGGTRLKGILQNHLQAADLLWQQLELRGGRKDPGSAVWRSFARAINGQRQSATNPDALQALQQGEGCGALNYELALLDQDLSTDCRDLIQTILLPQTRNNIAVLESILLDLALPAGAATRSCQNNGSALCY